MSFKLSDLDKHSYEWLKKSDLYESIKSNEENEEDKFLSGITCSEDSKDIKEFLNVGKFWIVNFYPLKFYNLLFETKPVEYLTELFEETPDPFYNMLIECLFSAEKNLGNIIGKNGRLDFLIWYNENTYGWYESIAINIAENGHLECLIYAYKNGCIFGKQVCIKAAENGHLECLKYGHENGSPWNKDVCYFSSRSGHLECLIYAHENGCPWDKFTYSAASKKGHLECLIYAHKNKCPSDKNTCKYAAINGHLECLKYAYENECFIDIKNLLKECKDEKILEYLNSISIF